MEPVIKDKPAFMKLAGADVITLSAEEAALAHELLAKLLLVAEQPDEGGADVRLVAADDQRAMSLARSVRHSRQVRAEHFASALFSEPAWDMLLVLYTEGPRGGRMSVTQLAEISLSPLTTAIRWLDYLESQRMIVRTQCPEDRRKFLVSLSEKGTRSMTDYFCRLLDAGTLKA